MTVVGCHLWKWRWVAPPRDSRYRALRGQIARFERQKNAAGLHSIAADSGECRLVCHEAAVALGHLGAKGRDLLLGLCYVPDRRVCEIAVEAVAETSLDGGANLLQIATSHPRAYARAAAVRALGIWHGVLSSFYHQPV